MKKEIENTNLSKSYVDTVETQTHTNMHTHTHTL